MPDCSTPYLIFELTLQPRNLIQVALDLKGPLGFPETDFFGNNYTALSLFLFQLSPADFQHSATPELCAELSGMEETCCKTCHSAQLHNRQES